jgi:hypothetical protein
MSGERACSALVEVAMLLGAGPLLAALIHSSWQLPFYHDGAPVRSNPKGP